MQNQIAREFRVTVTAQELLAVEDLRRLTPEHRETVLSLIAAIADEFAAETRVVH